MQMFGREENTPNVKRQKKKRLLDYFLFLKESPGNRIHALDPERSAARWAC